MGDMKYHDRNNEYNKHNNYKICNCLNERRDLEEEQAPYDATHPATTLTFVSVRVVLPLQNQARKNTTSPKHDDN